MIIIWRFNMPSQNLFHSNYLHCASQKYASKLYISESGTFTKNSRGSVNQSFTAASFILNCKTNYIFKELHSYVYYPSSMNSHSVKYSKFPSLDTITQLTIIWPSHYSITWTCFFKDVLLKWKLNQSQVQNYIRCEMCIYLS